MSGAVAQYAYGEHALHAGWEPAQSGNGRLGLGPGDGDGIGFAAQQDLAAWQEHQAACGEVGETLQSATQSQYSSGSRPGQETVPGGGTKGPGDGIGCGPGCGAGGPGGP